jgi:hypothetical protein
MFAFVSLSLFSCKDDDQDFLTVKDELVGTWDITSYKVAGDEYMELIFQAASISFGAYTGPEGEFLQEVTFTDEESLSLTGPYKLMQDAETVRMEYEGDVILAKVKITNGDKMVWDGTQDGYPLVIKADKR